MQGEEATIMELQGALEETPLDHPDRVQLLTNLAEYLCSRYEETGDLPDLDGSIEHSLAAVEATQRATPTEHKC